MPTLRIAVIFIAAALAAFPIEAQVLVETGILSSPKKPRDPINSIWDKAMGDSGKKAAPKTTTVRPTAAASTKPKVLPETFSGETEDPMSILGIDTDVLTRFSTALAAESKRRGESPPLKRLQYEEIVAPVGGFTPRQYWVLKERVRPFCEAIAANLAPSDNLTLSYMPSEAAAIKPRCADLLPSLQLNR